jgi:hypothetical protein
MHSTKAWESGKSLKQDDLMYVNGCSVPGPKCEQDSGVVWALSAEQPIERDD